MDLIQRLKYDLETYYNYNYKKSGIINPNFYIDKAKGILSWNKYEPKKLNVSYKEFFKHVIDKQQYSFQLGDLSCFQLFYEVKEDQLKKANLAFLPNPEEISKDNYIRFDCDIDAHIDYIHTAYHAHFGYDSMYRITLSQFPSPENFINFVLCFVNNNDNNDLFFTRKKNTKLDFQLDEKFKKFHFLKV